MLSLRISFTKSGWAQKSIRSLVLESSNVWLRYNMEQRVAGSKHNWELRITIQSVYQVIGRALWSGQFWALQFGTTLQNGGFEQLSSLPSALRWICCPWNAVRHRCYISNFVFMLCLPISVFLNLLTPSGVNVVENVCHECHWKPLIIHWGSDQKCKSVQQNITNVWV